jgi:hypothetical protein
MRSGPGPTPVRTRGPVQPAPGPGPAQGGPVHLQAGPDPRTCRFGPVRTQVREGQDRTPASLVVTDRRACLGPILFEELTIMNAAWRTDLFDIARSNNVKVDDVSLLDFEEMLVDDGDYMEWDKDLVATTSSTWHLQGPLRYEDM